MSAVVARRVRPTAGRSEAMSQHRAGHRSDPKPSLPLKAVEAAWQLTFVIKGHCDLNAVPIRRVAGRASYYIAGQPA
ncbi:MAG TPA: hypothetical protein VFN75_06845 [Pseudonocardiaceae bacterium]|nr:hypothetical protein [Pseudonocardiaceae bacterium]